MLLALGRGDRTLLERECDSVACHQLMGELPDQELGLPALMRPAAARDGQLGELRPPDVPPMLAEIIQTSSEPTVQSGFPFFQMRRTGMGAHLRTFVISEA
jgi:hypothetical protein